MPQTISKVKDDFEVIDQIIYFSGLFRISLYIKEEGRGQVEIQRVFH